MYKFKGKKGEYVAGVPARHLSADDYAALTDEQRSILDLHMQTDKPLYKLVDDGSSDDDPDDGEDAPKAPEAAPKKAPGSMDAKAGGR